MRYEKAAALLQLACALAASAEGMTLDEMCAVTGEKRRTIERMRDALQMLFPQLEEILDGASKRFRIPGGLDGFIQCPTTEELLELGKVVDELRRKKAHLRTQLLDGLNKKIQAAVRQSQLRRIAPDLEALLHAELIAVQAGPRPVEDREVLRIVREAILETRLLRFKYLGGTKRGAVRQVVPYGIMFGRMNYLIAAEVGTTKPKHWKLNRIQEIEKLPQIGAPPSDFHLVDFANASFGFFQGTQEDVVLYVRPHAVDEDFESWRFHPNQIVERQPDGGAIVKFRATGMLELAWHLFTWGNKVEIIAPVSLRELMTTELRVALAQHEEPPRFKYVAKAAPSDIGGKISDG